ncbi:MAG: sulfatase [Alphaproteobacteria bacterium]|nr:sulfatase [Alphaproteobacteria bacterium]
MRKLIGLAALALLLGGAGTGVAYKQRRVLRELWRKPSDAGQVAQAVAATDWSASRGADRRPDVVVVVLDTVRADRLELHGHARSTMPRLAAWAQGARVHDDARANASWTLPSHASLFTGADPLAHGAHRGAPEQVGEVLALPDEAVTLAEHLGEAGYRTAAVVGNTVYGGPRFGVAQGFEIYLGPDLRMLGRSAYYPTADRITDVALGLLDARGDDPVFLFLNYMDAHQPIVLRPEHLDGPVDPELVPDRPRAMEAIRAGLRGEPMDAAVADAWSRGYEGELRFLDVHLSRLLDGLAARGIDGDDLVVVTSDHGEEFGELGTFGHGLTLHDAVLRIPLLVRGPGVAPGRDPSPVQLHDIPRWVTDAAGLPPLPGQVGARTLQVAEQYGQVPVYLPEDPALRARLNVVERVFVHEDRMLLRREDGGRTAWDLAADPGQQAPLAEAPWAAELEAAAEGWEAGSVRREGKRAEALSVEEQELLKGLGYAE